MVINIVVSSVGVVKLVVVGDLRGGSDERCHCCVVTTVVVNGDENRHRHHL